MAIEHENIDLPRGTRAANPRDASADVLTPLGADALMRLQAIIDGTPDCIFVTDANTRRLLFVNEASCRMTGFEPAELLAVAPNELLRQTPEEFSALLARTMACGDAGLTLRPHIAVSKDGERKGWWEPHFRAVSIDDRPIVVCVSREVSARVLAERAALRAKRLYATLSAVNEAIMRMRSQDELFQRVCDVAVSAGGFPSVSILLSDADQTHLSVAAAAAVADHRTYPMCLPLKDPGPEAGNLATLAYRHESPFVSHEFDTDATTRPWRHLAGDVELKAAAALPIVGEGRPIGVLLLCAREKRAFDDETLSLLNRITENLAFGLLNIEREAERERVEERIRYLATHDSLTGLPNRLLFGELLSSAVQRAARYDHQLALLFIDLDRFKQVNDTLGHLAGDLLLKEVSARLRAVLRSSDVVARIGGDEFVVLVPDVDDVGDACTIAEKLLAAALMPVTIMGNDCRVSASIGIGLFPTHARDDAALIRAADAAMYQAKQKGRNAFALYTPG